MDPSTNDSQLDYERLRSWYLASLRSKAIEDLLGFEHKSLTPATLIDADSRLIQKLLEQDPVEASRQGDRVDARADATLVFAIAGVLVAAAFCLPWLL